MVVRRLQPILVEAVVRGYLIGSGYKEYQDSGSVCGITLPAGPAAGGEAAEPIFTPAAKAAMGEHDENITLRPDGSRSPAQTWREQMRDISLALYRRAADYAATRGIIIADTKFEFGLDEDGTALPDGRGADAGFVALLAGRRVPVRHVAAELRQAVRPRLPRNRDRVGQARRRRRRCRPTSWHCRSTARRSS